MPKEFVPAVDKGLTPCGDTHKWILAGEEVTNVCQREIEHPGWHSNNGTLKWLHEGEKRPSKRGWLIQHLNEKLEAERLRSAGFRALLIRMAVKLGCDSRLTDDDLENLPEVGLQIYEMKKEREASTVR